MNIRPMKRYARPAFPTRAILDAHPELLRLVPRRWRSNAIVLAALAAACAIVSLRWGSSQAAEEPTPVSQVAPIFPHGEGRGTYGCDAVSPPVFLSEDEARQVVFEEARRASIVFTPDSQTLEKIAVPVTTQQTERQPRTQQQSLVLDGTDAKRRISFEYVSQADFSAWEDKKSSNRSTVSTYDMLGAAKALREGLAQAKPAGTYGVFYDPMVDFADVWENARGAQDNADWNTNQEHAKMIARYELRQQVRGFIAWLKAEGVI